MLMRNQQQNWHWGNASGSQTHHFNNSSVQQQGKAISHRSVLLQFPLQGPSLPKQMPLGDALILTKLSYNICGAYRS